MNHGTDMWLFFRFLELASMWEVYHDLVCISQEVQISAAQKPE